MSLIGTAIGALAALLPPALMQPKKDRPDKADPLFIAGYDAGLKDGRLEAKEAQLEAERLTRSHARLVGHIETLEREILIEQHISAHWKEEAERLARASREAREERGQLQQAARDWQQRAMQWPVEALLSQQQQAQSQAQLQSSQYAQQQIQAQQNVAMAQQHQLAGMAQQNAGLQGQQNQNFSWRGDYEGFCNCVPSRAQVWGADRGDR